MSPLERAVMEQALYALEKFGRGQSSGIPVTVLVHNLRQALAATNSPESEGIKTVVQQEPVLFIHPDTFAMANAHVGAWKPGHELPGYIPLYTAPQPAQQEPVAQAWLWQFDDGDWHDQPFATIDDCENECAGYAGKAHPLYTSPPPPAEVPLLTDREITKAWNTLRVGTMNIKNGFARAIEQAVRQKALAKPVTQHPACAAQFNAAIDFAITQGSEAATFLDAWRHGDTSDWPEFEAVRQKADIK